MERSIICTFLIPLIEKELNVADKKYDVFGVGNAIVDILAQVEDSVIGDLELNKGGMALMSTDQQGDILLSLIHI